ncbi:hypothetical protein [Blastococcus xanthinilyticus]|uniref:Uncharacterized protein n=1 Tax=Blastococcus xanthinilyticus TaxID=1564164 RepID=A0A5S5CXA4_9ACTN|nr:hypothetical protein [Blastococcus xanthinilyticus]TYP88430.1 hypothetical protein BD833_104134 [Blastococcus xanthinilyticus]
MALTGHERVAFRLRGLPISDQPTEWQSGPVTWQGRHDIEPLAGDVPYGEHMVMPASVAFRFRGQRGAPTIEARVEVVHGVPELSHFAMTSTATGGLRSSDLRNVFVDGLVLGVAEMTAQHVEEVADGVYGIRDPEPRQASKAAERARRGRGATAARTGRRPVPTDRIRYTAEVYRDHLQSGPRQAVIDHLGVTGSTADRYIARARAAGFLPATTPGKAKG